MDKCLSRCRNHIWKKIKYELFLSDLKASWKFASNPYLTWKSLN